MGAECRDSWLGMFGICSGAGDLVTSVVSFHFGWMLLWDRDGGLTWKISKSGLQQRKAAG